MRYFLFALLGLLLVSCSPGRQIRRELTRNTLYNDHLTGFALYDPGTQKTLIAHNTNLHFTPASNTKLVTFLAGLMTLTDSLPAIRYVSRNDSLIFWGTGHPLLLHPDLPDTALLGFLRNRPEKLFFSPANYTGQRFGAGWAWDDYNDDYSAELAPLPVYGNLVRFTSTPGKPVTISPRLFADSLIAGPKGSAVQRQEAANRFTLGVVTKPVRQDVPFRWSAGLAAQLLADTLKRTVTVVNQPLPANTRMLYGSVPADSLYKRMLQVSDNMFAEHILLMGAAQTDGQLHARTAMNVVIDKTLNGQLKQDRWVDGSGLSRYNVFTPDTMIQLLQEISRRAAQQRLFALLPAAGRSGTLRTMNNSSTPYIFAKSGSMTGVYNLSGYIVTKKGKVLLFSMMHNNFTQTVSEIRKRTADFLAQIHERF
ncbi:D-alanyl-D-alanine carboxypeptidase/D-alanyl-D-alanine endopeptidase [Arsenicibacter rosenii]|uniref:D-alanyl-D-alanine carboxypeptidase/D-alanyl-D-alanine-endopeptidase n=1 Tax=Arsenicibacter rosenii TaxID=1750698 RepID=A0A1S2VMQ5_9BACT|nr:D-alanyl-D-alanine carboxypeptidase/D-alanyl-D-alanine-endopeptidase [Arsenicibacter rosenii]OIN60049.1 D-alanyl-D-alanine carboxypeptidase/D-alanyl-D-alanine-endopeptidase [Arsenicibacter rosenii]